MASLPKPNAAAGSGFLTHVAKPHMSAPPVTSAAEPAAGARLARTAGRRPGFQPSRCRRAARARRSGPRWRWPAAAARKGSAWRRRSSPSVSWMNRPNRFNRTKMVSTKKPARRSSPATNAVRPGRPSVLLSGSSCMAVTVEITARCARVK